LILCIDRVGAMRGVVAVERQSGSPGSRHPALVRAEQSLIGASGATRSAIHDLAEACREEGRAEARAGILRWLGGFASRRDVQRVAGADSIHHMHEIGQRKAVEDVTQAIRRGDDLSDGRSVP
jgi:methylmalonyl-CoA mutase cobalamin-binding subunit